MTNLLGEFFGTMTLVVFGDGLVACALLNKSKGQNAGWVHITIGWGAAVVMGVFAATSLGAPQADINPAVTMAKMLAGTYTLPHAMMTMLAQVGGGILAGVVVWLAYLGHWEVTEDKGLKLAVFSTGPAIRNPINNFITEMIGTIFLVVPIMFIFSSGVKEAIGGLTPGFGPFLVGWLVMVIGMALGGPTGYAINPARDLGPRIAHFILPIAGKGDSDWGYAWIPVLAPLTGGAVAYFIAHALGVM